MSIQFDVRTRVREDLRDLVPYDTHPYPNVIRMDLNENPYPFPEAVCQEIIKKLNSDVFTRYPDPGAVELRQALADYNGVAPDNLIAGNGSDELIQLIYLTFGGNDRTVLIPVPTFSMFKIHARITGTGVEEMRTGEDFAVPVQKLVERARAGIDIVVLVSPNNPTGTVIPPEDIMYVLENTSALVIVDEAYFEFKRETIVSHLNRYPNLIVLRTFSKAFGLAGMRVGYLISNESVIKELNKIKQPFNVNSFSQLAARTALKYRELFDEQIGMIIEEREKLFMELQGLSGVTAFPSQSNFILFRTPVNSDKVYQELLKGGILIRNLGKVPGLEDCLRVTIGKKEENAIFLEKLGVILRDNKE
ncbi:histidinol-phosphate transaminase [Thermincola potens]|uniref:Histidinol-phosphate aminotransferase n=1 Tax=Thermincola potens (strain JR) TaxID=635013 RepID=D5XD56_THEPJ|nr:histidinol-phosphate transaminase [Thermincola potens]ADG81704.1 histidinol-phosphate aminotransferase [Thermincola potens JR]